jgi:large subunit ribosomal protein L21
LTSYPFFANKAAFAGDPGTGIRQPYSQWMRTMFAVVKTGGKQYKVAAGDIIQVEKLAADAGKKVELAEVVMLFDAGKMTLGSPFVAGAKVAAEVVSQGRTGSLIVFKKKRRQNYRRKNHHRQHFTVLKITAISA